jgi:hypothetical protein
MGPGGLPLILLVGCLLFLLAACGEKAPVCPQVTGTPGPTLSLDDILAITATPDPQATPRMVKIGGKEVKVDKFVEGPLCNDNWSGTVYVGCGAQVAGWQEEPLFFKDCNLVIKPGTVVYVAAHNDTAYYKGCSCHTGEEPVE